MKAPAKHLALFLFLSLVFLSSQSPASSPAKQEAPQEKWEYYADDEDENGYFYNSANVQHLKGNLVQVWVQAVYSAKNQKYSEGRFLWEIDCTKKRMRGLSAYAKKKDGTSDVITDSSDWSPIPAESTAETLFVTVCKKKSKQSP